MAARYDFNGRTVIVTGAANGIGLALSREFASSGADVVMVDVDREIESTAEAIGGRGLVGDVSASKDVDRVVQEAASATGRIDILVNNAGVLRDGLLWKLTDEDWDLVLAVHLGGAFKCTRACVPHFRELGEGRVINVTSYSGLRGNRGQANYAAAKAGVIGFTKTAAKELAHFNVTVNAISPNAETRMVEAIPAEERRALEALIPLRRFGTPEEMWPAVAFLASEEARYVTGAVLRVDGGIGM
jgi:3-oxoacyl-[acyl-carrier protein] reductase